MTIDEVEQLQMAQLILRENEAEETLDEAREELALWVKRGKLALKVGRTELATEAKRRALQAKRGLLEAQQELERVAGAKRRLRREARRPEDQPTTNAELLVEQFRMRGLAPEEQELEEIADRQAARMAVEAMKGATAVGEEREGEEEEKRETAKGAKDATGESSETAGSEVPAPVPGLSEPEAGVGPEAPVPVGPELSDSEEAAAPKAAVPPPRAPDMSAIERELAALKAAAGNAPPASAADAEALAEIERALATPTKAPDGEPD